MKQLALNLGMTLVLATVVAFSVIRVAPVFASAPSGLPSTVATTSQILVGPGVGMEKILFATSTNCASRIISSVVSPLMLQFTLAFGSTTLPNGTSGHLQAASTTIAYDSGLYGCNAVVAYAFSSTTISISETR